MDENNRLPLKPARLWKRDYGNRVRCGLCERRCVIEKGRTGICKTRVNIDGKLYTLLYGNLSAVEMRPIEIKPFHHFKPGSWSLTYSSWSCNFFCKWCQNWRISRRIERLKRFPLLPDKLIEIALREDADGMCCSFNEPTLLHEFNLEVFELAKEKGLYNTYVSNGYMTQEAVFELKEGGLDAINIDIKGDDRVYREVERGANVEVVWRNARIFKELGIHIEMIFLVIPGINWDEKTIISILEKHLENCGEEIPIHINRYYPAYKFEAPATDVEKLEEIAEIYKRGGIKYVYVGNVPGHPLSNTHCPNCGELLIERTGYTSNFTENFDRGNKKCKKCGYILYGKF
jgi:pyruvate formate lyase activating enzyme